MFDKTLLLRNMENLLNEAIENITEEAAMCRDKELATLKFNYRKICKDNNRLIEDNTELLEQIKKRDADEKARLVTQNYLEQSSPYLTRTQVKWLCGKLLDIIAVAENRDAACTQSYELIHRLLDSTKPNVTLGIMSGDQKECFTPTSNLTIGTTADDEMSHGKEIKCECACGTQEEPKNVRIIKIKFT